MVALVEEVKNKGAKYFVCCMGCDFFIYAHEMFDDAFLEWAEHHNRKHEYWYKSGYKTPYKTKHSNIVVYKRIVDNI